ncbi:MAG: biopolymer transporter Tol [Verrucomicrobiae bacterium]|nr:biopolymer transporter Tol [Verrucomicrobiae bacterium]
MKIWRESVLGILVGLGLAWGLPEVMGQVDVVGSGKISVDVSGVSEAGGLQARMVRLLRTTMMLTPTRSEETRYGISGRLVEERVEGTLEDRVTGRRMFSRSYPGGLTIGAGRFADDVLEAITGVKGFMGSEIAFISADTGFKELCVAAIDGGRARRLTNDRSISNAPAWSPDGRRIAYTSYRLGYPDVYVVNLDTMQRTRVAYFNGLNSGAAFSPDGWRLALTLSRDGNPEIYVMNVGGGGEQRLTRTRGTETSPRWSPDGRRIVFSSDDRGTPQLYIMNLGGGGVQRLVTGYSYNTEPDWSPDGKRIAFTVRQGGVFSIAVYEIDGAQTAVMCVGESPSWTRNSRHLVFSRGGQLYILDTETKQTQRIDVGLTKCTEPAVSR